MDTTALIPLLLLIVQCVIVGALLLFLFKLRSIFGLSLLFTALGVFQYMQTFLVAALYLEIMPGVLVSPGSMVMFTGSLFAVLLIYIKEDALEARKVIYALLAANMVVAILHFIFSWSLSHQAVLNIFNLPNNFFTTNIRILIAGSVTLFLDAFIIILLYEIIAKHTSILFFRILLTMTLVVGIDSLLFSLSAFAGTDQLSTMLISGFIAKIIATLIYTVLVTVYLNFFDQTAVSDTNNPTEFNDLFQTLTYRQKFEKIAQKTAIQSLELQKTEIKFRELFDTMAQGVTYQNHLGELMAANPAAERILGLTLDQMQGKTSMDPAWKAIHEDGSDFPGEQHASMVALRTGKAVSNVVMGIYNSTLKDYKWIKVDAIPQFRNGEKVPYQVFTTFNDITAAHTMQQRLNELFTKYQNIIHTANIAIAELDTEGNYTFVNPTWEEMFGYSSEEVLGKKTTLLIPDDETDQLLFNKLKKGKITEYHQERKYKTKNGKIIWCDLYVASNHDLKGNLSSIVGVMIDITEQKHFGENLAQSEHKYKNQANFLDTIIENSPFAMWISDANGYLIRVNQVLRDTLELPADFDITKYNIREDENYSKQGLTYLLDDVFINHKRTRFEMFWLGEETGANNVTIPKKLWVFGSMFPIIDETGKLINVIFQYVDISERKEAEEALKTSEQRFRTIVEDAPDPIFIQLNKKFAYVNQHALELFGAKDEKELLGKPVLAFFHPDFHQTALDRIKALNEAKEIVNKPFEQILIQVNGTQKWVETKGAPITYKGESGGLVFVRDITSRKESEQIIRESEEKFFKIFQSSPNSIILTRLSDFEITDANNATFQITGYTLEELKGKKQQQIDIWKSIADRTYFIDLLKKNGMVKDFEAEFCTKSGESRIWLASAEIIQISNEKYILGIIEDVTEIRKAEQEIKEAIVKLEESKKSLQKLTIDLSLVEEQQRKAIAANIHDHLSQSLVISKMKLNDIYKNVEKPVNKKNIKTVLNHISEALDNTRRITYDLSPPVLYELGLIEAIHWFSEKIESESNIKVVFETEYTEVNLTEPQLILVYRAIQEILNNAVKHSGSSKITILFSKHESHLLIVIKDFGIGFDITVLDRKHKATSGFGLFAVKERINNLNGTLIINSAPKMGTEVSIMINLNHNITP